MRRPAGRSGQDYPRRARAATGAGEERDRLWSRAVAAYGDYETYQRRTDRQIPVIVLEPAEA